MVMSSEEGKWTLDNQNQLVSVILAFLGRGQLFIQGGNSTKLGVRKSGSGPSCAALYYVTLLKHVLSVPLASVSPSLQGVRESVLL